jgi:hypothetical protein
VRAKRIAWSAGVAAGGVGLYLAFAGSWPAAVACVASSAVLLWLGGAWVLPGSRAAYLRRVRAAWTDWAAGAQWAYGAVSRSQSGLAARVEQLAPPPELSDEHERLMALLRETEAVVGDGSAPLAERARQSARALRAVDETTERLTGASANDAQRRYAAALDGFKRERLADYAASTRKAELASERAFDTLDRMRPPSAATSEHAAMVEAFREYVAAARAFHAAADSSEPERAGAAAQQLDAVAARLRSACAAVVERLDGGVRRPNPADAPAE